MIAELIKELNEAVSEHEAPDQLVTDPRIDAIAAELGEPYRLSALEVLGLIAQIREEFLNNSTK